MKRFSFVMAAFAVFALMACTTTPSSSSSSSSSSSAAAVSSAATSAAVSSVAASSVAASSAAASSVAAYTEIAGLVNVTPLMSGARIDMWGSTAAVTTNSVNGTNAFTFSINKTGGDGLKLNPVNDTNWTGSCGARRCRASDGRCFACDRRNSYC